MKQRHKSRSRNGGLDLRALVKAEGLLADFIAAARRRPPQPQPVAPVRRSALPARELTPREVLQTAAKLVCLGESVHSFALPIQIAARVVEPADLASFSAEVEGHILALAGLFDSYLTAHPGLLKRCDGETRRVMEAELSMARADLAKLAKVATGKLALDIGESYLPQGFDCSAS